MKTLSCRKPGLFLMSVFLVVCMAWNDPAYAAGPAHAGRDALLEQFHRVEKKPPAVLPGMPAYLDSYEEKNISGVDIYGVIDYPFESVEKEIMSPAIWCNIIILHPNIRACTYRGSEDNWRFILFNTDKFEQSLSDASQLEFTWKMSQQPGYIDILLSSPEGPYSTRDHRFALEAAARDEHRTILHLSYSYAYGGLASVFMKSYFAIFNRGKVGFSTTGGEGATNPAYTTGLRGLNERNVVRYYLALVAHLETLQLPAEQRMEKSLSLWHELAAQYKRQLAPGEKKGYIARKKLDLQNQLQLQQAATKLLN